MSVPAVAGHVLNSLIPNLFQSELIDKRYESGLLPKITNAKADNTGIKQMGDKVTFQRLPDTTIKKYTKGMDMTMERLQATDVDMFVNKANYFYFGSDAVDLKQYLNKDVMNKQQDDANAKMEEFILKEYFAAIYADADADNKGIAAGKETESYNLGATGAPVAVSKTSIVDQVAELAGVAAEQKWKQDGRYLVLPAHFATMLAQSELKDNSLTGQKSVLFDSYIGKLHGFDLYTTNQYTRISDSGKYAFPILFGHEDAVCYVEQLTELKYFEKLERQSGEAMRGLSVYDWKTIDSTLLGCWYAYKA